MRVLHLKARRDLRHLGLQAVTVALLVGCGVGLLVAAWSSYETLGRARDQFYIDGRFGDVFAELKRAPRDLVPRIRELTGVLEAEDRVVLFGRIHRKESVAMGRLQSVPSKLDLIHLRRGRLPRAERTADNRIEVVVHEAFAEAHGLGLGETLRAVVEGVEEQLAVVGVGLSPDTVYALSGRSPFPDDRRFGVFWCARGRLEQWGSLKDSFNALSVIADPSSRRPLIARLEAMLTPYGVRSVVPRSRQLSNLFVEDEIRQQRVSALIYPVIFLGVAAFLIQVATSRWIELQRPQIATLKALGYSNRELTQHLAELVSWILAAGTAFGLLLGTGLGRVLAWSYQQFFRFPALDYHPSPLALGLGLLAGTLPGLIGSAGSLRRIFRLEPAEAMRPLSPPEFRGRIGSERFSIPLRMAWRNLFLRRLRLTLAVAGIAAGISIVVLSGSWNDILKHLIDVEFSLAEREDVSAFLVEPRPLSMLGGIRAIPGVLAVQGNRFAPARIRFRQHERDVAVMGWPEPAQPLVAHRRRIGLDLREERLPSSGLLLPSSLARLWGVRVGDWVRLEIREGSQPERSMRVEGFSESRMGNIIHLPHDRLSRILGESPSVSLVTIQAESGRWEEIQRRLEEMPGLAGASIKRWRLEGFLRTVGRVIRVSTLVLGSFAFVIAGGVVFNLVRVGFSERSWEMASLRVLGFSRSDVFLLLSREVAFEVGASLAPGFALGYLWVFLSRYWIHTEAFSFPVIIDPSTYGVAALTACAALAVGLASCWLKTRRLSPISALQARE